MLLLHTGREEGRGKDGGGVLRFIFDIDTDNWVDIIDFDIDDVIISVNNVDGKKRVKMVIRIPDDLLMEPMMAEEEE